MREPERRGFLSLEGNKLGEQQKEKHLGKNEVVHGRRTRALVSWVCN